MEEFLSDLSGCQASLVFTLVDQNFGGILLEQLKSRANDFTNLVLLSGTRQAKADHIAVERPLSEFFYPHHYAFRLGHYDLYGVEDLLTYAVENLPLSRMHVSDIEAVSLFLSVSSMKKKTIKQLKYSFSYSANQDAVPPFRIGYLLR